MVLPDFDFEKSLLPPGSRYVLGIDEVGRGPWAGPVTVGAFLLDTSVFNLNFFTQNKIRDSKKLSPIQRQKIYQKFLDNNFTFSTFSATSEVIDQKGIAGSIYSLVNSALEYFRGQFDFALIDGNMSPQKIVPCQGKGGTEYQRVLRSIVSGDARCFSIASASICAKVVRDLEMDRLHQLYPNYDFSHNKGYGTPKHLAALTKHGPCPIHRRSYKPVKNFSH